MLVCEALFRSLRDIPMSVSDPSVGLAKLGWWQKELTQAATKGSQHPVVRALIDLGLLKQLSSEYLTAYLHGLMMQLQEDCLNDTEALKNVLRDTAGNEAQLLSGASPSPAQIAAATSARLCELMRTLSHGDAQHAWLPLDLVARHKLTRSAAGSAETRAALVEDLAGLAQQWRDLAPLDEIDSNGAGGAFIVLRDSLVGSRLAQAQRNPAGFLRRAQRRGVRELFASWTTARHLLKNNQWTA